MSPGSPARPARSWAHWSSASRPGCRHEGRVPMQPLTVGSGVSEHAGAELGQGASQKPGYVHLGNAQFRTDLGLGHLLAEAHLDNVALPVVELFQERSQSVKVFHEFHGGIAVAKDLGIGGAAVGFVVVPAGSVEPAM